MQNARKRIFGKSPWKNFCVLSILALLITACGTKSNTSNYVYTPLLSSAVEMEVDGASGIWMNADDTAALLLYIESLKAMYSECHN